MPMNLHQKFLSQLPDDWDQVPIEKLGFIYAGGTPSRNEPTFWDGAIAWVTPAELTILKSKWLTETKEYITEKGLARSAAKLLPKGALLITTRATIGSIVIAGIPVCTNQGFKNIVPNELTNSDYYYYLLQEIVPEFYRLASGSTFLEISRRDFVSIIVPRPEPDEQSRIAGVLDALDAAIQRTDTLINKLKWMKAGLLNDLLTRGLDHDGELRDPVRHPEQFKESRLGLIPKGWKVEKLMSRVSLPSGQLDPRHEPYLNWPLIAPDHIESGTGRLLNIQTAAEQNAISGKYGFESGDVLYSKIRPYLQKAVLADRQGLCSADMYPLRPDSDMDSRFLLALILSEHFTKFASAISMRSGFPKINRDELKLYESAMPDHEEQKHIAAVLDSQGERIRIEEVNRDKLMQIKEGLMHDLLTGRVRVPAMKSEVVAV